MLYNRRLLLNFSLPKFSNHFRLLLKSCAILLTDKEEEEEEEMLSFIQFPHA
jgi:hypothetical protein